MIGYNEMNLNPATIMAAVQHYFDTVLFKDGESPKVTGVSSSNGVAPTFRITMEPKKP
jgi:hypothetical protein